MEYFAMDYAEFDKDNGAGHFTVEDLLDFSEEDETMTNVFFDGVTVNSGDSSTITQVESCNSSVSGGGEAHFYGNQSQFPGNELCIPYDDLPELEWLSNFVEDSFSADVIPAGHGAAAYTSTTPFHFPCDVSVPGKARSKRSRAAPCDWSSRLLHVAVPNTMAVKKTETPTTAPVETPGRKCLHCASEKTPQWRTGPMGPKTLCNACGVRYKSGRLVPEYRPAASPTFVSAKHSNSHRKVIELRRQKEVQRQQQLNGHISIFNGCDEFIVHHNNTVLNGQDFMHMM